AYSAAVAVTTSRQRMLVSSTFALSTEHNRPPRRRAVSNPTRAMRRTSLAVIDVAGQLADDHEVETRDDVRFERRRSGELRVQERRSQVREQAERLAD